MASMPAVAGFYGAPVTKVLLVASVAATCKRRFSSLTAKDSNVRCGLSGNERAMGFRS